MRRFTFLRVHVSCSVSLLSFCLRETWFLACRERITGILFFLREREGVSLVRGETFVLELGRLNGS